jgi:ABC-type antimicrobial peptide transport system permease subunit
MRLAVAGVVIGAVAAVAAGRILQSLLAGVSVTDAPAFGAATGLVVLATAAGSLLPALRAVRVDPVEVMRAE